MAEKNHDSSAVCDTAADATAWTWGNVLCLTAILMVAGGLRGYRLDEESLWLDEGFTVNRLENTYLGMLRDKHAATQPPAYYWLNKAWYDTFGSSVRHLRLPSAVFGTLGVLATFLVGRTMFSTVAGLWAAFLLAINPFAIHYSQEARPYSLFMLAWLVSLLFLTRLMKRFGAWDAVGYALSTLLVLYGHAYGPFILVFQVAGVLIYSSSPGFPGAQERSRLVGLLAITLFLFVPQLRESIVAFQAKSAGAASTRWMVAPEFSDLLGTLRYYFAWTPLCVTVASFAGVSAIVGSWRNVSSRPHLLHLLAAPACFMLAPWLLSRLVTPIFSGRYTCASLPAVLLLCGWGLASLPVRIARLFAGAIVLLTFWPLFCYYTKVDKDPFRQAAEIVERRIEEGDVVVVNPPWAWRAFVFHFARPSAVVPPFQMGRVESPGQQFSRIWEVQWRGGDTTLTTSLNARSVVNETIDVNRRLETNPFASFVAPVGIVRRDVVSRDDGGAG